MKVSVNWLKDYLAFDLPINELSELLTDIGLEVEGIEEVESVKGGLKDLVIGQVLTCVKHENADRLNVTTVNVGEGSPLQIVCGAPNVAVGQKVIVAPVNSTIHPINGEPFTIKKAKIRGEVSFGMICAEDEIGLGEGHDGILVLDDDAEVGQLASDYFNISTDTVIEIGLTPNRSDANSHLGTARDLAAAIAIQHNKTIPVNWPNVNNFKVEQTSKDIHVTVEAPTACPRYTGVVIDNIQIGESPNWLKERLSAIGVKTINNIVDITNFINHEYGQPLHAFDYDKINDATIVVKQVKEGTKFTTLDGVERSLSNEDLMICDSQGGMCIAGVYGGLGTGVTEDTTTIFLESAYFNPKHIRRTELRHNLRTDAAQKFEKGVDPTNQIEVLKRAALLIQEYAGGIIASEIVDIESHSIEPASITLNYNQLNKLTGVNFAPSIVKQILTQLEFKITNETEHSLALHAPLYRADVTREADVIEEVLRIYGFNNVPLTGIANFAITSGTNQIDTLRNEIGNHLSANGFYEIMTNSITKSAYYNQLDSVDSNTFVQPINSLNSELDIMRPDMLMTGLESIAHNQNRNMPNCKFYEFGKTYRVENDTFTEQSKLAIYMTGNTNQTNWLSKATTVQFYDIKQRVEEVLKKVGITAWNAQTTQHPFIEEGLFYTTQNGSLATFGLVKQEILDIVGIKQDVLFAVIDMEQVLSAKQNREILYQAIPKVPAIQRDLALVINREVSYQTIEEIARKYSDKQLKQIELFDVFADESKLGKGKKSYAVSFTFQGDETLTNKQVDKRMSKLMKAFEEQIDAVIRT